MTRLGHVTELWRYPVKSMAGERLEQAFLSYSGVVGDRAYALLGLSDSANRPWLTARQRPLLVRLRPRYERQLEVAVEHPELQRAGLVVHWPDGEETPIESEVFQRRAERDFGCAVRVRHSERAMVDAHPVSMMSSSTIDALSQEVGRPLDLRRFRANVYVQWNEPRPFFEDELVDRELSIGDKAVVRISKRDQRCRIVGIDPDTGEDFPDLLQSIVHRHERCAGVYAVVIREGAVRSGDPIRLVDARP
jgi:uncharacterized protein YcbX